MRNPVVSSPVVIKILVDLLRARPLGSKVVMTRRDTTDTYICIYISYVYIHA